MGPPLEEGRRAVGLRVAAGERAFCYAVLTRELPVLPAAVWPHLDPEQFPERYRALVEQIRRVPKEQLTFAQIQRGGGAPPPPRRGT